MDGTSVYLFSRNRFSILMAIVVSGAIAFTGFGLIWSRSHAFPLSLTRTALTKDQIGQMLLGPGQQNSVSTYRFPTEIPVPGYKSAGVLQYSFDPNLQDQMEQLFNSYKPDYGAFVAVDAETGKVLSLVSYEARAAKAQLPSENLAFRATFPSASVFKVVTAAAAIEEKKFSADTVVTFNGSNHSLYKGNILKNRENRWTRHIKLKEAFAKSINTVFGRIGAFEVGPTELSEYALRFGFNRAISADIPIPPGKAAIPQDSWGLAEAASGFTRENTMSPVQGAMIAAAVVNYGVMMEPYFVQSVFTQDGKEIYSAQPKVSTFAVDPSTASEIRELMRATVKKGTAGHTFRGFDRHFKDIEVGGKTGSLTGLDPKGKYDWFVGYAEGRGKKIAFAALTIHEKLWRVKSSYLARRAIESYFK